MKLLPWRKFTSWACQQCGKCCTKHRVMLKPEEAYRLRALWPHSVETIDEQETKFCLAVDERQNCIFLKKNFCTLQPLGLKPLACKVWPFYLKIKPLKPAHADDAAFAYGRVIYYVYVNPTCAGFNKGSPAQYGQVVQEIIELVAQNKEQRFSTAQI